MQFVIVTYLLTELLYLKLVFEYSILSRFFAYKAYSQNLTTVDSSSELLTWL